MCKIQAMPIEARVGAPGGRISNGCGRRGRRLLPPRQRDTDGTVQAGGQHDRLAAGVGGAGVLLGLSPSAALPEVGDPETSTSGQRKATAKLSWERLIGLA